jgi:hypothetical protein
VEEELRRLLRFRAGTVRVSRYRPAVLFDALLDYTVRHGEHLIYEVSEAFVFDVTRSILGGRFRVTRHGNAVPLVCTIALSIATRSSLRQIAEVRGSDGERLW